MRRLFLAICITMIMSGIAWADAPTCSSHRVNHKGTSGAGITVDNTTAGVVIAEANESRCHLWVTNETANPMRCAPSTGKYALVVSSTVGFLMPANTAPFPIPGENAKDEWRCIRTGGSSATVNTLESLPY